MNKNSFRTIAACLALAFGTAPVFGFQDAAKFPFRKGINLSRLEDNSTAGYLATGSTYTTLKAKGFDHVRLPVDLRNFYDSGTKALKSNISIVDDVLDKCEAAGLYVFLDFHGWATIDTSVASQKEMFLKIWELVADRYKNRSGYVVFELLNEPHTTEGGNLDADALNALQAEVLPIIRNKREETVCAVGPPLNIASLAVLADFRLDERLVLPDRMDAIPGIQQCCAIQLPT